MLTVKLKRDRCHRSKNLTARAASTGGFDVTVPKIDETADLGT